MLLQCRKVAPHICSPTSESCSPKHLCKAVAPKRLCFKPVFESVPESYSPKWLPEAAPQSCVLKYTPQRCSPKLRFFKAAVQSCSSKLLPKAAPQSCSPALLHKVVPKAVLQSCCPKAAESCSPKLLPKIAPQSCVRKLLPFFCPTLSWLPPGRYIRSIAAKR